MEASFEPTLINALLLISLAFIAGLIDSVAGGGGMITVPMYLAVGVPTEAVLGTNKGVSSIGTTLAVIRYLRSSHVVWKFLLLTIPAAAVFSAIGASLSHFQTKTSMLSLLIVAMLGLITLQKYMDRLAKKESVIGNKQVFLGLFLASSIGFYDGFFGPGTGTFLIAGLILLLSFNYQQASIHARVLNLSSNLAALSVFGLQQRIAIEPAVFALIGSLAGNWFGSGLTLRQPEKYIRPIFRLVITLLLLKCIYDIFSS